MLLANRHVSSVLTDSDTAVNASFCVHVHDGVDFRRLHPPKPVRQYSLATNGLLALYTVAMEMCLTDTTADVPNNGAKKIFRILAKEFGQGCVLEVVMHCRVTPSTLSHQALPSLST